MNEKDKTENGPMTVVVVHGLLEPQKSPPPDSASPHSALGAALLRQDAPAASSSVHTQLDTRHEHLMTVESSDGRPPTRPERLYWWKWLVLVGCSLCIAVAVRIAMPPTDLPTLVVGSVLVVAILAAAAPVWGAGLLRGREERIAREEALLEKYQNQPR